jgi:H+/Cl- antiporter ClcA
MPIEKGEKHCACASLTALAIAFGAPLGAIALIIDVSFSFGVAIAQLPTND